MSVWRTYRTEFARRNSDMSLLRRTWNSAVARRELRRVRHATFEQLSSAGYDVRAFDDGAAPIDPRQVARGNLPDNWKYPQPVITPKVAHLRDAVLFGDGTALLPDGFFCYSDIQNIDQNWRRLHRRMMLRIVDPVTDDALIRRPNLQSAVRIPGRCFSARNGGFVGSNFGHFVHCRLSRIYYEDLGAIVPGRDKVIAPPLLSPMKNALFRMVFEGYEIVKVPPAVPLKVEELLLPANLCKAQSFNPAAIASLARRMRRLMAPYAGKDRRRVCVSRRDGNPRWGRNFANSEEYETRMRELGYDVVLATALEPEKQFELWANTTDIVGIHGAGMMNMIMMPWGGNYTEIAGASGSNGRSACPNSTIRCALAAGHRVCGLSTAVDPQGRKMIDISQLEAALSCATP